MTTPSRSQKSIFLFASFISAIGDALVLFALPAGLGLETKDIRSAVLLWLIPAVAMFLSSIVSGAIKARPHSARRDYGFLLFGIALLELVVSVLALTMRDRGQTILLIAIFIFFYALSKEGVPRLLYNVSIYRWFTRTNDEYRQMIGTSSGLNILAALIGTTFAALIVSTNWRLCLLIDSATWILYGLCILLIGHDAKTPTSIQNTSAEPTFSRPLQQISVVVPILFGMNALVWNYLPLLSERFAIFSASGSILLIGLLRLPGMSLGLGFKRVLDFFPAERLIVVIPAVYIVSTIAFSCLPSAGSMGVVIVVNGLVAGIYWPCDGVIRNSLPFEALVRFNTMVLRRLATFQFMSCCIALLIFSSTASWMTMIPLAIGVLVVASTCMGWATGRLKPIFVSCLAVLVGSGCLNNAGSIKKQVILPSVSHNLEMRPELTYAAMAMLNDTSAHLLRTDQSLEMGKQVLKTYRQLGGGTQYVLDLDPAYRSYRGEEVTSEDVLYTIRYYLSQKSGLAGSLRSIRGATSCHTINCALPGVQIQSATELTITLDYPDMSFISRLSSPWIILLKKDRPAVESIGDCKVPYQTGEASISKCDQNGVEIHYSNAVALVTQPDASRGLVPSVVSDNPGDTVSPTLSVLASFANPASSELTPSFRKQFSDTLRSAASGMAAELKLKRAPLLTPQWLSLQADSSLLSPNAVAKVSCPSRPVKILLDSSLPSADKLKSLLNSAIPCPLSFTLTNADTYFREFAKVDFGLAWFTPDFIDLYDVFAPFDCNNGQTCYFDWHDAHLQALIRQIRSAEEHGTEDKASGLRLEHYLADQGYVAPIAEMNWWIHEGDSYRPIHPAGLFQIRVRDFL